MTLSIVIASAKTIQKIITVLAGCARSATAHKKRRLVL
jgi:hypothetical protein